MIDHPHDEAQRRYGINTLCLIPQDSKEEEQISIECPTLRKLLQYLKQPRRRGKFRTKDPSEIRIEDDDGNKVPLSEDQVEALQSLLPFIHYKQNCYGP